MMSKPYPITISKIDMITEKSETNFLIQVKPKGVFIQFLNKNDNASVPMAKNQEK